MSAAAVPEPDGALPLALRALEDAIYALIEPKVALAGSHDCPDCHNPDCEPTCTEHTCPGHTVAIDSLYMQLYDSVGSRGSSGNMSKASKSQPPAWVDAIDLLDEIDTALEIWQPAFTGTPPTVGRIREIAERNWRPQDCRSIEQIATALESWAKDIQTLLDPPPSKHVAAACPACGHKTAVRKDSAGEHVRVPALQLVPATGCTCLVCHAFWAPEFYLHLSRVLGFEMPEGVLE